jgi:hypothetical protein
MAKGTWDCATSTTVEAGRPFRPQNIKPLWIEPPNAAMANITRHGARDFMVLRAKITALAAYANAPMNRDGKWTIAGLSKT